MARSYVQRLLIALDELGNTALDGDPTETISSRVGRNALEGKRWALILEKPINWLALTFFGQADHCRASYAARLKWFKPPLD